MAAGASIDLSRVSVSRAGKRVLCEINLAIGSGEVVVLIGPSGSGKTTLLGTINRLVDIDEGALTIDGTEVRSLEAHVLRRRVGYCFQALGLFPHLTVAENIAITPRLLGWDDARIRERIISLLATVSLDARLAERLPSELSGGQAQRVAVARAIAAEPHLLLLDEPFGALDPDTRARLQDEVALLSRRTGMTMVIVSHDLSEALVMATKVVVLIDGRLAQVGAPRDVVQHPASPAVAALLEPARDRARQLAALDQPSAES